MPNLKELLCISIASVLLSACHATEGKHLAAHEKGALPR
jgi:hypothetical protein